MPATSLPFVGAALQRRDVGTTSLSSAERQRLGGLDQPP